MLEFDVFTQKVKAGVPLEEEAKKENNNKNIFKILNPFTPGSSQYFYSDAETTMPVGDEIVRF